ncbi:MAG: AAA family ATPase [Clostridia bacterium]|nr:AAA family ATPase [Clostridia bacterium]
MLFEGLKISQDAGYRKYLNRFNVIQVDLTKFFQRDKPVSAMLKLLDKRIGFELKQSYPELEFRGRDLRSMLSRIWTTARQEFVIIIDEWDCIFRARVPKEEQIEYMEYLAKLLKNKPYVALAYMTGILPIRNSDNVMPLNMFHEFTMTDAYPLQEFAGFTEDEVRNLCLKNGKDFEAFRQWYEGYTVNGLTIYNPWSVTRTISKSRPGMSWTQTESYDALSIYIDSGIDGVKEAVANLTAGGEEDIDPTLYNNDYTDLRFCNDVLTLLVHLGYLTYDDSRGTVRIPNYEIRRQFDLLAKHK